MTLSLRLAWELYNKLKKLALEEERSINGEINYIIKKYIEEKEREEQENTFIKN